MSLLLRVALQQALVAKTAFPKLTSSQNSVYIYNAVRAGVVTQALSCEMLCEFHSSRQIIAQQLLLHGLYFSYITHLDKERNLITGITLSVSFVEAPRVSISPS